jgi:hypothetical protein
MSYVSLRWKKPKEESYHISRWFVTINSNRTEKEMVRRLKLSYEGFYNNLKRFIKYMKVNEGEEKVISITDDPVIGIGKMYHRIHVHSLITIKHRTKLQLDYDKIRLFLNRAMGMDVFFNAIAIRDSDIGIRKYLEKNYLEFTNESFEDLNE